MTSPALAMPPGQPSPEDLAARLFRALYKGFDLHTVGVLYAVVPKGTCCFAGPSLGEIARQISAASAPAPGPSHRGRPGQAGTST